MSRFGLGFIRSDIGRFDLFRIYRCGYNQCHQDALEVINYGFILKNQMKKEMNKLKISTKLSNKENKAQFIAPYNCVLVCIAKPWIYFIQIRKYQSEWSLFLRDWGVSQDETQSIAPYVLSKIHGLLNTLRPSMSFCLDLISILFWLCKNLSGWN